LVGDRQAPFGARPHDERGLAELLVEDNAVISGIGLGQHRKLLRCAPVEPAAVDDDAANGDAVAADPFCRRIHDDVGAELNRPAEKRRCEGIVNQQRDFCVMRDVCNSRNIQHLEAGIADGLADHEPCVGLDRRAKRFQRARLDESGGDAEARQRMRQQVDGAAIERGRGDDVRAGAKQGRNGEMQRGHAARGAYRADARLQRGKPLLEHRRGRV
jgi:hypothetical protein